MAIAKPTVTTITATEELRGVSRPKINQNFDNLKAAIDALIDVVASLQTANGFTVRRWNGNTYPPRASYDAVPPGLDVTVGPVLAGDKHEADSWIQVSI